MGLDSFSNAHLETPFGRQHAYRKIIGQGRLARVGCQLWSP